MGSHADGTVAAALVMRNGKHQVEGDCSHSKGVYAMSDSSEEEEEESWKNPSQVQPFNIELLAMLVEDASPTLQHLKDQNVVILLGKTGTGKSTLMHAIAGTTIDF
jgi:putative ribosome biogenesis GTPase RsgA